MTVAVSLPAGLFERKPSVINVTPLLAIDRRLLDCWITAVPTIALRELGQGLWLALALGLRL